MSVYGDFSGHKVRSRNDFVQRHFDVHSFAGTHHAFEFGPVDSCCDGYNSFGGRDFSEQDRAALQAALAEDNTGNEGEVWEVALEEEFVGLKRLSAVDSIFVLREYFVDQQHWFAVWDDRFDFGLLHQGHGFVSRLNKGVTATPGGVPATVRIVAACHSVEDLRYSASSPGVGVISNFFGWSGRLGLEGVVERRIVRRS